MGYLNLEVVDALSQARLMNLWMLVVWWFERVVKRHFACLVMRTPGTGVLYQKRVVAVSEKEALGEQKPVAKIVGRIVVFALEPSIMKVIVVPVALE